MPYRGDTLADAERRLQDATRAHAESQKRVRATAASLRRLTARFERELSEANERVAQAEAAWRDAMRHGLAQDGGAHPDVRSKLRSAGVMAALERALRRARPAPAPSGPAAPPSTNPDFAPQRPGDPQSVRVTEAKARLAEARKHRARLTTQRDPTLEAARTRMRDAVLAHDEATEALEAARARMTAG